MHTMNHTQELTSVVGGFFRQGNEKLEQDFFASGVNSNKISLTDSELQNIIIHTRSVIAFLKGRNDLTMVVNALRRELDVFEGFASARGWKSLKGEKN